jgi:hypothetical protein
MAHGRGGKSWLQSFRTKQARTHWRRPLRVKDPNAVAMQDAIKQLRAQQLDKNTYLKRLNELLREGET